MILGIIIIKGDITEKSKICFHRTDITDIKIKELNSYINEFTLEEIMTIYMGLETIKGFTLNGLNEFKSKQVEVLETGEPIELFITTLNEINSSMDKIEKAFALTGFDLKNFERTESC